MSSLDNYLEEQHYFIQLLDLQRNFNSILLDDYNRVSLLTPEEQISASFSELIIIQKIVSAYSEDKYFVEPKIVLKAINEYKLMFCPSSYVPEMEEIYVNNVKRYEETRMNFCCFIKSSESHSIGY